MILLKVSLLREINFKFHWQSSLQFERAEQINLKITCFYCFPDLRDHSGRMFLSKNHLLASFQRVMRRVCLFEDSQLCTNTTEFAVLEYSLHAAKVDPMSKCFKILTYF